MSKTKTLEIRCLHCDTWFNSPIFFGELETLETCTMTGNLAQCPSCGKMTNCNKENMRLRAEKGGFLGNDTMK